MRKVSKESKIGRKVKITCTEEQALLIEQCLEIVSRIGAGQLSEVETAVSLCHKGLYQVELSRDTIRKINAAVKELDEEINNSSTFAFYRLGATIHEIVKPILFPQLHLHESYGVGSKETPGSTLMYEMYKILQNFRVRDRVKRGEFVGVLGDEPLKLTKEPLIEVTEA